MKRCPVCRRTYTDDALNYCLDDGASLASVASSSAHPPPYDSRSAPTEVLSQTPTVGNMAAPRTSPPSMPPHAPLMTYPAQKKSHLPLILGAAAVLVIGIIVTVLFVTRRSSSETASSNAPSIATASPTPTPQATPASRVSGGSWQPFDGDGFAVNMPGLPQKNDNTVPSAVGPIPVHIYALDNGGDAYFVGYSEYPSSAFASRDPEKLLDGARDGAVNNIQGEVTEEHPISLSGYTGREVTGKSTSQNISFTYRFYLANPRLYMAFYYKYGDQPLTADGRKFLDSFQIKD